MLIHAWSIDPDSDSDPDPDSHFFWGAFVFLFLFLLLVLVLVPPAPIPRLASARVLPVRRASRRGRGGVFDLAMGVGRGNALIHTC
ncbi:MAG: hypothetical protein ACOX52_07000 [Verrucomicrobiota bacterium]